MPNPKKRAEKADAASAKKAADASAAKAQREDELWAQGTKSDKNASAALKKAEQARKKEEKARLEAEESANLVSAKPKKSLNASNIEDALDALKLTKKAPVVSIEQHPERRFKAAYAAFEERRVEEMKKEKTGLRLQQMKELAYKEFQRSEENPFNQVTADHNATKDELKTLAADERRKLESRLTR